MTLGNCNQFFVRTSSIRILLFMFSVRLPGLYRFSLHWSTASSFCMTITLRFQFERWFIAFDWFFSSQDILVLKYDTFSLISRASDYWTGQLFRFVMITRFCSDPFVLFQAFKKIIILLKVIGFYHWWFSLLVLRLLVLMGFCWYSSCTCSFDLSEW